MILDSGLPISSQRLVTIIDIGIRSVGVIALQSSEEITPENSEDDSILRVL